MRTEKAFVGAVCLDSLPFSQSGTAAQAKAMRAAGADAIYGYLGVISPERVQFALAAGLAFMPVSLAGRFDGPTTVQQLKALNIPPGVTTCFDVEGLDAFHADPIAYAAKLNAGYDAVNAGGWTSGAYFGSPQPFTSAEMYALHCQHYWRGQGRIVDRHNALAEPTCGWQVYQMFPSVTRGGVLVDIDVVGQDYRGRVPNWMVAGAPMLGHDYAAEDDPPFAA